MSKQRNTTLYFAYGSNMSVARIQARVPSAQLHCNARLHGHQLKFHKKGADGSGKCDVVPTENHGDVVHGVVFEFDLTEKPILDVFEGPKYEARKIELISYSEQSIEAFLYVVADKEAHTDPYLQPYHWYKHHVLCGAKQAGFPKDYIETIAAIESQLDKDFERTQRELSIYPILEHHDLPFTV